MTLINDFLSLIYPRYCEACGSNLYKHEDLICNQCIITLPHSNYHLLSVNEINLLFAGRVPLVHALCIFNFEKSGRVQKLIHALKYQNQMGLGIWLGNYYANLLKVNSILEDVDLLIPIPLHKKKLKQRGYNQSECYAKGLSEIFERPMLNNCIQRLSETSTQTKKKKFERWQNVEGVFKINNPSILENKHVLLVDDVITTGATIDAAWQTIKDIEGIKISVISIAFAAKNF
jgi:ComF family protein